MKNNRNSYTQRLANHKLEVIRFVLETLDGKIISLIAERAKILEITRITGSQAPPDLSPRAIEKVVDSAIKRAMSIGAPAAVIEATYRALITSLFEHELAYLKEERIYDKEIIH